MSYPVAEFGLSLNECATSAAAMRVAAKAASPREAIAPYTTASKPSRASGAPSAASRACEPTSRTSAAATPSGYGRSDVVTIARRKGIVNSTPRTPPDAQTQKDVQNGNPV